MATFKEIQDAKRRAAEGRVSPVPAAPTPTPLAEPAAAPTPAPAPIAAPAPVAAAPAPGAEPAVHVPSYPPPPVPSSMAAPVTAPEPPAVVPLGAPAAMPPLPLAVPSTAPTMVAAGGLAPEAPGASSVPTMLGPVGFSPAPLAAPEPAVRDSDPSLGAIPIGYALSPLTSDTKGRGTQIQLDTPTELLEGITVRVTATAKGFSVNLADGLGDVNANMGKSGGHFKFEDVESGGKTYVVHVLSVKSKVYSFAIEKGTTASDKGKLEASECDLAAPGVLVYALGVDDNMRMGLFVKSAQSAQTQVYEIAQGHPREIGVTTTAMESMTLKVSLSGMEGSEELSYEVVADTSVPASAPARPAAPSAPVARAAVSAPASAPTMPHGGLGPAHAPAVLAALTSAPVVSLGVPDPIRVGLDVLTSTGVELVKGQTAFVKLDDSRTISIQYDTNGLLEVISDGKKQTANPDGTTTIVIGGRQMTLTSTLTHGQVTITASEIRAAPAPRTGPSIAQRLVPTLGQGVFLGTATVGLGAVATNVAGPALWSPGVSFGAFVALGIVYCVSKLSEKPEGSK